MNKVILKTKLMNRIKKADSDVENNISNIIINGNKRGCSGFIWKNDRYIYINTESIFNENRVLFRTAEHNKDYSGGHNQWSSDYDEAVRRIVKYLNGDGRWV